MSENEFTIVGDFLTEKEEIVNKMTASAPINSNPRFETVLGLATVNIGSARVAYDNRHLERTLYFLWRTADNLGESRGLLQSDE